ncbi:MAG: CHASE2 domain-containing protein [Cyanobacteria bacterium SBLK]|nr:CHASE2 domain-containing protein [Cyanobacteria bacterium SBLK]
MTKTVILELEGDFESGFRVKSEIPRESFLIRANLPANPLLARQLEEHWQEKYRNLEASYRITLKRVSQVQPLEKRIESCRNSARELSDRFQDWLDEKSFQELEKQLRSRLGLDEEVRFAIRTDDRHLQKLPWQEWSLLRDLVRGEVALSPVESRSLLADFVPTRGDRVRILAIFGFDDAIDVTADRQQIEALPNAIATCLLHPSRQAVLEKIRRETWDIIIFSGHGQTEGEQGFLQINREERLLLDELWWSLRDAVKRGLQLAIFNSCDGLGLSRRLDDIQIPQAIVMRELVPDRVAQRFLIHFLEAFAGGRSLYESVREARQLLQEELEGEFPCASWLPIVCQHPAFEPPLWEELYDSSQPARDPPKEKILRGLGAGFMVAIAMVALHWSGVLQPLELQVYDRFLRMRPDEGPDSRLLVIEVTERDLQLSEQSDRKGSLSDAALERLLRELELAEPRAIALNIIRDFPVAPEFQRLRERLQSLDRFFAVCNTGVPGEEEKDIAPPPEVEKERLGFANVLPDDDGVVRRHLLSMDEFATSACPSRHGFSLRLALFYLQKEGIVPEWDKGNLKLGNVVFQRLRSPVGMYRKADTWGTQVLLNYRAYRSPGEFVEKVTLEEVLRGKIRREVLRDRLILIGTNHVHSRRFSTPYGEEITSTMLQAQSTSQVLSAVLEGRSLLRFVPWWGEFLWLLGWTILVAVLMEVLRSRLYRFGVAGVAIALTGMGSYWLLLGGYWLSWVLPVLAIALTILVKRLFIKKY